jgi:hypothetical protein
MDTEDTAPVLAGVSGDEASRIRMTKLQFAQVVQCEFAKAREGDALTSYEIIQVCLTVAADLAAGKAGNSMVALGKLQAEAKDFFDKRSNYANDTCHRLGVL